MNLNIGVIGVVSVEIIVENDIVDRTESFWVTFERSSFIAASSATKFPSAPVQGKAARISRLDRIQSTLFSYFIFLSSPLTNNFVKVPVRWCIVISLQKNAYRSHFIVDVCSRLACWHAVEMLQLYLSIVSNSVLGVLGSTVDVNMGKMPPLTESLTVVDSSKSAPTSLDSAFKPDSVHNPVLVFLKIIVNRDWLCDSEGMTFDSKGIRVF
mmetsp:Transcript_5151/g.12662  ORF Transcript_5151/g.12662 Transcript_5151/m.12662 type:complete len:211 (-) Transcript_5151:701-1333(-)